MNVILHLITMTVLIMLNMSIYLEVKARARRFNLVNINNPRWINKKKLKTQFHSVNGQSYLKEMLSHLKIYLSSGQLTEGGRSRLPSCWWLSQWCLSSVTPWELWSVSLSSLSPYMVTTTTVIHVKTQQQSLHLCQTLL